MGQKPQETPPDLSSLSDLELACRTSDVAQQLVRSLVLCISREMVVLCSLVVQSDKGEISEATLRSQILSSVERVQHEFERQGVEHIVTKPNLN